MEEDENGGERKSNSDKGKEPLHVNADEKEVNDVDCNLTLGFSFTCDSSALDPHRSELDLVISPPLSPPPPTSISLSVISPPLPPPPPSISLPPHQSSSSDLYHHFMNDLSDLDPVSAPPHFPFHSINISSSSSSSSPVGLRRRKNPSQEPKKKEKTIAIPCPFPWAKEQRATVQTLHHIVNLRITEIPGEMQCRRCEARQEMKYDLMAKYLDVSSFIAAMKHNMNARAPAQWTSPIFPECQACAQQNSMRPVVAEKKRNINWLFMMLGQTLGCCTLNQLKYFCKHSKIHRTGAKDRLLYYTYLGICKQLNPSSALFDY